MNGKEGNCKL
uniref:Uncharacterized protein n=1 Tax=Arundo donax TaxID=35708 RepID=A0A0A9FAC9_ARUDO